MMANSIIRKLSWLCAAWLVAMPVPAISATGVVSASHPAASAAGARMLAAGGNAIDAAVAIQFALNVVEPQSSGIGGGGFMMVHIAHTGQTYIVDSRERAPRAATPGQFAPSGTAMPFPLASTSGLSVGVPGTLRGIEIALDRWGTKPLSETLVPAMELASMGFRVNRFLAEDIARNADRIRQHETTASVFHPGGRALVEGDWLVQPDLARTLRILSEKGVDAFYSGPMAQAIVEAQKHAPEAIADMAQGRMTLEDLADYRAVVREPLMGAYRGWTLAVMPQPSSGGLTLLQILGLLESYPLGDVSKGYGFGRASTLHLMTEAMRLAFADRAVWMGDDDHVTLPGPALLAPDYVASRARLISPDQRMVTAEPGKPLFASPVRASDTPASRPESLQTTHFSVIDRWGNVVSYTSTIEATWGSGIMVPGYGFLLNNELTDFNFIPTRNVDNDNPGANDVAPGKRPRSSMVPVMLFKDGRFVTALGSPGGPTIINSVLNTLLNRIDHGMTLDEAVRAPRWSVTHSSGRIGCEGRLPFTERALTVSELDVLRALGHASLGEQGTEGCQALIGSVQAVERTEAGELAGVADPRREGTVIRVP